MPDCGALCRYLCSVNQENNNNLILIDMDDKNFEMDLIAQSLTLVVVVFAVNVLGMLIF